MTNLIDYHVNQNLKPCPCCGGKAAVIGTDQFVLCVECKLKAPSIEAWNRRAEPQKVAIAKVTFTQEQIDEIKEYCLQNLSRYTPVEAVD